MPNSTEHPLIRSSRREALVAVAMWFVAMLWSVGICTSYGYDRAPKSLTFVLGFPDWVFWGLIVPWGACTIASGWFAFAFMKDEDLESVSEQHQPEA